MGISLLPVELEEAFVADGVGWVHGKTLSFKIETLEKRLRKLET